MKILVVCGAGASSTFVAQRVRHAAQNQGLAYSAFAGTEQSLPIDLDAADVVLVGPHLAHALDRIERDAAAVRHLLGHGWHADACADPRRGRRLRGEHSDRGRRQPTLTHADTPTDDI